MKKISIAVLTILLIISCQEKSAENYFYQGLAKSKIEDFDSAILFYNKAIELDPLMANAYGNRANAYRNTKKYKEAIDDYDKSIEIKPNDAKTYHNRGTAKRDFGHLAEW